MWRSAFFGLSRQTSLWCVRGQYVALLVGLVSTMTKRRKIIIVGPVGAGKTTAIKSVTDDSCIVTDVKTSDVSNLRKELTTVAMDFGIVPISEHEVLHVYGAPGQDRFSFMWDILSIGAFGVVLLIDNCANYPKRHLHAFVSAFDKQIKETRFILGVTRTDLKAEPELEDYAKWLGELGINADVACVDPREKDDVLFLLNQLLSLRAGHTQEPLFAQPNIGEVAVEDGDEFVDDDDSRFDDAAINAAVNLNGVGGVCLTNGLGQLVYSTINNESLNRIIAFVSGLSQTIEEAGGLGPVRSVTLKSPGDDSLTVLMNSGGRALGLSSERGLAAPLQWDQVEELRQWVMHTQ